MFLINPFPFYIKATSHVLNQITDHLCPNFGINIICNTYNIHAVADPLSKVRGITLMAITLITYGSTS